MMSVSALLEIFVVWFQLLTFITLTGLLVSSSNLCTLLAISFVCIIIAFPAHIGRDLSTMIALNVIGLTVLRTVGLLIESDPFNSMMGSVGALLQVFRVRFPRSTLITPTDHFLVIFSTLSMIGAISFLSIMDFPIYDGKNLSLVNFSIMISLNLFGLTLLLTVVGPLISIIELLMERFTTVDPSLPDWSELPEDLLVEIINRVRTFEDFLAAAGVSKSWRSASHLITYSNSTRRPLQPPWLMFPETLSSKIRRFVGLFNGCGYKLLLDEVYERRSWGSPHGWLITIGPDFETCLVHLLQEVSISLPSLGPIRNLVAGREEWFRLVHRFIHFKESSPELSFLVIAIFGPTKKLAFTRVAFNGGGAALNRRGLGEWVIVTGKDDFNDVARFQDQFYGICGNGILVRLELDALLAAEVHDVSSQPNAVGTPTPHQLYLVGSSENLFAVYHYGFYILPEMRFRTTYFAVYKFNFNASYRRRAPEWERLTDLGDLAVFVGDCKSWCIPASNFSSRSNCIYFTDSNWEWQRLPGVAYGGRDVGLFNMALGDVQLLEFGEDNPSFYSRSIWITPAMRLDEFSLH